MKKLLTLVLVLFCAQFSFAQSPQKMSYQSVIRNTAGELVVESTVGIQISIFQGSPEGPLVYLETHSTITNVNGLANLEIGTGTIVLGTFSEIAWSDGPYFIESETDSEGGDNYTLSGISELLSVPYALYAGSAGDDGDWEISGENINRLGDGNVGIGTSNPQNKLRVHGNIFLGTARPDPEFNSLTDVLYLGSERKFLASATIPEVDGSQDWITLMAHPFSKGILFGNSGPDDINPHGSIDAKFSILTNGNVGVGTVSPENKLHVVGSKVTLQNTGQGNGTAYMDFESVTDGGSELTVGIVGGSGDGIVYQRSNHPIHFGTNDQLRMTIDESGNVGIGAQSPSFKFDVRGNARIGDGSSSEQDILFASGSGAWQVGTNNSGSGTQNNQFYIFDNGYRFTVQAGTGNVGIGTTTPQSKLAVNGKITCKEVEVTLSGFPDYVFETDYNLMSLKEIEAFIALNGHLPNVPSAAEVEENGLGLGEMNKILLEKVEELTLHAIESEKRIAQLEDLLKRVSALESSIEQK